MVNFCRNRIIVPATIVVIVAIIAIVSLAIYLPKRHAQSPSETSTLPPVPATTSKPEKEYFPVYLTPEQVHLSLGENINEYVVTWVTLNKTAKPTVWYGVHGNYTKNFANGDVTEFTDGGKLKLKRYIHRVRLSGLQPDTEYTYHVGSSDSWSNIYRFKTMPEQNLAGNSWTVKFLVFGDLGNGQAKTLSLLQDEIYNHEHDVVFHVGDFAYNLEDDEGRMGDAWFRDIEPIATQRPYQVCVGNHEKAYNFSNYDYRFSMYSEGTKDKNNWFWSYNIGNAHVVIVSTEFYYFPQYFSTHQIMAQYKWLEEDLKKANLPENRKKYPWLILMGHRPLYNQYYINEVLRVGNKTAPGLEKLLYDYGVDLAYWGHDHIYERIWPVYNNKVYNGSLEQPYTNPRAPVHITTGSAGCFLSPVEINPHRPAYSAFADPDYSFTRMKIFNESHLHIEQVSQNKGGKVIDSFYLIQEHHGSFNKAH